MNETIVQHATRANFGGDPYAIEPDALGHRTRGSDSSIYDIRCITCNATDAPRSNGLKERCTVILPNQTDQLIDQITEFFDPHDQAERVIIRAAVAAAVDVTHETGDPDTFRRFVISNVRSAFGRYWGH